MNKRKRKKLLKKQELFNISFVTSYKELKAIDRQYHQYVLSTKRREAYLKQRGVFMSVDYKF